MSSAPVAVLVLVDAASLLWAWMRLVRGPRALAGTPGLRFAKVLGSGHEGGFGMKPSASRGGLFCIFEGETLARDFLERSPELAEYRRRGREFLQVLLRPYSSRGSWDGMGLEPFMTPPAAGPVAALTRASIKPSRMLQFWRLTPDAQRDVEMAPGCQLKVGLGEAPLLRQATFSIWDDVAAMDAYARHGAHLAAIKASASGRHFTESMFVRFVPEGLAGDWKGRHYG